MNDSVRWERVTYTVCISLYKVIIITLTGHMSNGYTWMVHHIKRSMIYNCVLNDLWFTTNRFSRWIHIVCFKNPPHSTFCLCLSNHTLPPIALPRTVKLCVQGGISATKSCHKQKKCESRCGSTRDQFWFWDQCWESRPHTTDIQLYPLNRGSIENAICFQQFCSVFTAVQPGQSRGYLPDPSVEGSVLCLSVVVRSWSSVKLFWTMRNLWLYWSE